MNTIHRIGALLLLCSVAFAPQFAYAAKKEKGFSVSITEHKLKDRYDDKDLKILIVPGHEPNYGGAVFMGVYEREINLDIANALAKELRKDKNIEVVVARSSSGWHKDLKKAYARDMKKIEKFVSTKKADMEKKVAAGAVKRYDETNHVDHATAATDVALRLYGLNKWANDTDVDLVLNLHVNDSPDHGPTTPGANSGFAIYIPL